MTENIYLYYTNDLHSHFENWPRIVGHWKERRNHHNKMKEDMFLLDVGDHVDRFHPISEAMMGKANIDLLNKAGYNWVTLGNNEGITLTHEDLYTLYDEATFDVACANLSTINAPDPTWLEPYSIQTTSNGTKIAVIGLTAPFYTFYKQMGWEVVSPFDKLDELLGEIEKKADIIVLLSHLGINDDEAIANRYNSIDVIIGGHTHHLFKDGEYINGTLLSAAGKHGMYVGQVALKWDKTNRKLTQKSASAYSLEMQDEDKETVQLVENYTKEASRMLHETVAQLSQDQNATWFETSEVMKNFVKTLKDWTDADVAMLNAGVLLEGFPQGPVTRGDIHRKCPHPMNPCKVELKGDQLMEVIRQSHAKRFMELKLKGFGFRGEVIGRMVFDGVDVQSKKAQDGQEYVTKVIIDGEKIDPSRTYSVATADTFTFGRLLPEIANSPKKEYFMPELLRDLLLETLKQMP
ncbi:bifunctional UDP-sugar hydrolase/5'-nucleotidase [Pontibacillus salipaludis]|uniref:bifunctional metallophosphatase/5'-nucleotidase n=1 Tax=Pontibacillus salipaludis TaxID=1697394 RepID=UPI0031E5EEB8